METDCKCLITGLVYVFALLVFLCVLDDFHFRLFVFSYLHTLSAYMSFPSASLLCEPVSC